MAKQIEILFGLKGGSSIKEGSGKLIHEQLNSIAKQFSNDPQKRNILTLGINKEKTKQQIQHQLDDVLKDVTGVLNLDVKFAGNGNNGNSGATFKQRIQTKYENMMSGWLTSGAVSKGSNIYQEYEALMKRTSNAKKKDLPSIEKAWAQLRQQVINESIASTAKLRQSSLQYQANRVMSDFGQRLKLADPESFKRLEGILTELNKPGQKQSRLKELASDLNDVKAAAKEWGTPLNKIFGDLGARIKGVALAAAVALLRRSLRDMYKNVVDLDKAVTDLQVASGKTRAEVQGMVKDYSKLAQELGTTTAVVAQGADTWLRQGYSGAEATELLADNTKLAVLGQMDSKEAATALTSAMKGYKKEVNEAIGIVDKFTAVDMVAAASAGDIATAMSETAVSANVAGISMDKLIGYLTVVKEVTQDGAESVGTFYKTLFARMGNIKAGKYVSDDGEDLNDTEKVLKKNGIALRDNTNNFRNFGDVLDEVASKWDNYDNVTQHAIATAFAGTRQQEKFFVLMENYSTALEYEAVAAESAGTANKKYTDAYLDSIEARKNAMTAAYESLSQTVLNSELVKGFYTAIARLLSLLDTLLDNPIGKAFLTGTLSFGIVKFLTKIPSMLATIGTALTALKTQILGIKVAEEGATVAASSWNYALLAVAAIAGIISAVVSEIKAYNEAELEKSRSTVDKWLQQEDSRKRISELYSQYKKLTPGTEEYKKVESQLSDVLSERVKTLKELTPGTKEYAAALSEAAKRASELSAEETANIEYNALRSLEGAKKSPSLFKEPGADEAFDRGRNIGGRGELALSLLSGMGYEFEPLLLNSHKVIEKGYNASGSTPEVMWNYLRRMEMYEKLYNERQKYISSGRIQDAENLLNDDYYQYLYSYSNGQGYGYQEMSNLLKASMQNALQGWRQRGIAEDDVEGVYSLYAEAVGKVTSKYGIGWAYNFIKEDLAEYFNDITGYVVDEFEGSLGGSSSTSKYIESFFDTISGSAAASDLKGTTETIDKLAKAIEEMDGVGQISLETAQELAELDAKYVDFLDIENGQLVLNTDALRKNAVEKLEAAKATAIANQADERTIELYDKLIENAKRLGNSNTLERYLNLLDYENTIFGFSYTTDAATPGRTYKEYQEDNYKRARRAILEEIDDYRGRGYSTASPEIMELYKKYIDYSEKQIALRKDMLSDSEEKVKDGIEKENDALEKQKDLLNDIVEARKKALENLKNEKKYQDELADKQKTVSDLETRLATARLDTSASGRANARKIEDELQKARKDLDDFNFDHAVDVVSEKLDAEKDENERLYEQQKADNDARLDRLIESNKNDLENYEEKIKGEVDLVKDALNNLNPYKEGENSVYSRIVEIEGVLQTIEGKIGNENVFTPGGTDKGTYFAGKAARLIAEREAQEADDYKWQRIRETAESLAAKMADSNAAMYGWDELQRKADYREKLAMFLSNPSEMDKWLKKFNIPHYHTGGIVGGLSLGENEVFAKLMKGEFVSTPSQMSNFLNKTLPSMTSGNEFNAPLITLQVGSVTEESLPRLEAIVKQAADRVKSELMEGFSKTGFRSSNKRTLSYKVPAT